MVFLSDGKFNSLKETLGCESGSHKKAENYQVINQIIKLWLFLFQLNIN